MELGISGTKRTFCNREESVLETQNLGGVCQLWDPTTEMSVLGRQELDEVWCLWDQ